jgi:hypothetical protein
LVTLIQPRVSCPLQGIGIIAYGFIRPHKPFLEFV